MTALLDHLVVAARSLDEGARWCEATLGVAPRQGGKHAFMGTHNLLLDVSSARFPRAYLEIIAIDSSAPPPGRPRWFDLDAATLQADIARGPRLVHWVARSDDLEGDAAAWRAAGHDVGTVTAADRITERGLLSWRITVPDAGARAAGGAVPLLIEWAGEHPTESLPPSGVALESVRVGGTIALPASRLGVSAAAADAAPLTAVLACPRGRVELVAGAAR